MLVVTTAATDRSLLTTAELRAAVGATDGSRDAELVTLGARIAATITRACRVASDGVTSPTLRLETLTETIRIRFDQRGRNYVSRHHPSAEDLLLSRRPIVSIDSVTEASTVLTAADYEIEAGAGMLRRLSSDEPTCWPSGKMVVVYSAGWATVPDDLKLAAAKLASAIWTEGTRDPNLRSYEVPGVLSESFWVGPADDPMVPNEIMDLLGPYINRWVS